MSVNLTPVLIGGVDVMAKAINAVATDPGCYHDVWVSHVDQGFEYSQGQSFVVIGLSKTNPREAGYSFKSQGTNVRLLGQIRTKRHRTVLPGSQTSRWRHCRYVGRQNRHCCRSQGRLHGHRHLPDSQSWIVHPSSAQPLQQSKSASFLADFSFIQYLVNINNLFDLDQFIARFALFVARATHNATKDQLAN